MRRQSIAQSVHIQASRITKRIKELDKLTREDLDVGFRGGSTVVLTGVYRGRGYVQFYDVPPEHFSALVEEFQSRRKEHLIRNIDAPHEMLRAGGAFTL